MFKKIISTALIIGLFAATPAFAKPYSPQDAWLRVQADIATGKYLADFNATHDPNPIQIILNGEPLVTDQAPIIRNGTTLMPMRAIFEGLGLTVDYDNDSRTAYSTLGSSSFSINYQIVSDVPTHIIIDPNTDEPFDAYHYYEFNYPPTIINGRSMMPIRFLAESTGCKVDWDNSTRTVTITGHPDAFHVMPGGILERV